MKKICHVTSAHPIEDGRIYRRACISTAKAGYETYLVEQGDTYDKDGVHIIGIGKPQKPGRLYRMTAFAKKAYEAAVNVDADLYQLHDPELLPYAMKLKKLGKAVVFDSHENYAEQLRHKTYLPGVISKIVSWAYDKYSRRIYSRIDGLTYPGNEGVPSVFDDMNKLVAPTDNLPWLSELYDEYVDGYSKIKRSVCYIGALDESRGITKIVEAAYDANCTLYLAGKFYQESYREALQSMKEYACVKYLGVIDRQQVLDLLRKVEVGLCVLLDVGQYHKMLNLPTKVYEYMSMGIPVVFNKSPYNMQINDELQFGICVDPDNRKEIADAITMLITDKGKRIECGENGRKAIRERFCWDKAQHNLIDMYKTILRE